MRGGDENGEGVNMVNTNAELILQHSLSHWSHMLIGTSSFLSLLAESISL